ncbi:hypothetical protein [Microbacterium binotii]|uniref:Calcineurin-like phosphoesterase domain-containing protein n=1 Tax=Microbacterium binotii TaxID=462710 RepID=A0ABN3PBN3_9MICO
MTLANRVRPVEPEYASRSRAAHPKGWEPGIAFDPDSGIPTELTTPVVAKIVGDDYANILDTMQVELPDGYELRLVAASYDPVAWTRDAPYGEDGNKTPAVTRPAWRYRFAVVPSEQRIELDALALLGRLKRTPKPRTQFTGDASFVTCVNDWQIGKVANGMGTPDLLERLDRYFDGVIDRAKDLGKRNLGELVILAGGDLVEGSFIYPNQAHQIDRNRRQQSNTATEVFIDYLDRVTGLFPRVRVLAVPGNHGEHRVDGRRIDRHDNDDVKVIEDAARTVSRDSRMQHVSFVIAQEQPALTMDVQGHIVALTHGNVYGKAKGATPDQKAYEWYKNMAAGHHPVGDATVLVGNHFHHDIVKNYGSLLFVQTPAADNGSPEFADYSGTDCPAGMTTFVMTERQKFRDYEVIR